MRKHTLISIGALALLLASLAAQQPAKLDTTARYTRVATKTIGQIMSPLDHITCKLKEVELPT